MDFLRKLFGRRRLPQPVDDGTLSPRVAAAIDITAQAQPCVRIVPGGDGRSRLGGTPDMASAWPRYEGRPLCCVAQLNLTDLRAAGGPEWLPAEGRLLFFYELEHGAWGLYPEDAGSSIVLHETGPAVAAREPDDLPPEARFPAYPVAFFPGLSMPTEERVGVNWRGLNAVSDQALEQALVEFAPASPAHQIAGYPFLVQSDDMEAKCQRVAPRAGKRPGVAADWRLLLQLDTDDEAGMMWGDVGSLYFWIREQDARAGDFSNIWTILQCN